MMNTDSNNHQSTKRDTLTGRTGKAARWQFTSVVLQSGLQFIVGVVLARLLPPEDFGLVALAMIIVGFTRMFADLGFGPAVVQRRSLTSSHVRVGFTASVGLGGFISVLIYFFAPFSVLLFDNAALPDVLKVLGLTFLITGFGSTARALLRRELAFKKIFKIDLLSSFFSFPVSISMALTGFGVWSLVAGALIGSLASSILNIVYVRHSLAPLLKKTSFRIYFLSVLASV